MDCRVALLAHLGAAVPLRVQQLLQDLQAGRTSIPMLLAQARVLAVDLTEQGDVLQGGGRRGAAVRASTVLVEALSIAVLFAPDGVEFLGERWRRPPGRAA